MKRTCDMCMFSEISTYAGLQGSCLNAQSNCVGTMLEGRTWEEILIYAPFGSIRHFFLCQSLQVFLAGEQSTGMVCPVEFFTLSFCGLVSIVAYRSV